MKRLRLLLAWFLLAAVPLQGFAAASMLFCGNGSAHAAVEALAQQAEIVGLDGADGHDHGVHRHAPDSSVDPALDGAAPAEAGAHSCSVCAACCQGVALLNLPVVLPVLAAPRIDSAEPFVLIAALPSSVPDKPPRA